MATIGTTPWYKDWLGSPFYHKLHSEQTEGISSFIKKLIDLLQAGNNERVLEIGCGRGERCQLLAEMGFDVTGLDLSFENIQAAKKNEQDKLEFFQHDIRLLYRTNYYHYTFSFFPGFGYFPTSREVEDAFRAIAAALIPGGTLVIECLNVHFAEEYLIHHESKHLSGTKFDLHRWDDENYFYKKITVSDPSLLVPEEFTEKYFKWSLGDITDMLAFRDLQVIEVFGDRQLIPYHISKTPRMIIVAKKKQTTNPDEQVKRLYSDGRQTDPV